MSSLAKAVTLECRALPVVRGLFEQTGIVVHEHTRPGQDMSDRLAGYETLVHFFLDTPICARYVVNSGIRRVVVAGPASGAVDEPVLLTSHGIALFDTPGRTVRSVAEHTVCAIFSLAKNILPVAYGLAQGQWPRLLGREIKGQKVGLVGFGAVAREVASMCRGLGMVVWVAASEERRQDIVDMGCEPVDLGALLKGCDFVSLHKRLVAENRGLLSAAMLALMRPDACLINTSRAELIDGPALLASLDRGGLAAAALDVFETEPLPTNSVYRVHKRVMATPHSAWLTTQAVCNLVASVGDFLSGQQHAVRQIH